MIVRTVKPKFAAWCNVCNSQHMIEGEPDKDGSPSLEMREQASKLGFTLVMIHFQTPTNIERGQHSLYFCPVCVRALISAMTFSDKEAVAIWETVSASFPDDVRELWRQPAIKDVPPIEDTLKKVSQVTGVEGLAETYTKARVATEVKRIKVCGLPHPIADFGRCVLEYKHEGDHKTVTGQGWPREGIKPVTIQMKDATVNVVESTVGLPANTCALLQNKAEQFKMQVTDDMSAALKRLYAQKGTVEDLGLWREIADEAGINLPSEAQLRGFDEVNEELRKNA